MWRIVPTAPEVFLVEDVEYGRHRALHPILSLRLEHPQTDSCDLAQIIWEPQHRSDMCNWTEPSGYTLLRYFPQGGGYRRVSHWDTDIVLLLAKVLAEENYHPSLSVMSSQF